MLALPMPTSNKLTSTPSPKAPVTSHPLPQPPATGPQNARSSTVNHTSIDRQRMPPLYARFCCPLLATTRLYQETAGISKPITIESATNANDTITSSSQSLATPHNTPACQQFIATGIKLERSLQNHHIRQQAHFASDSNWSTALLLSLLAK